MVITWVRGCEMRQCKQAINRISIKEHRELDPRHMNAEDYQKAHELARAADADKAINSLRRFSTFNCCL